MKTSTARAKTRNAQPKHTVRITRITKIRNFVTPAWLLAMIVSVSILSTTKMGRSAVLPTDLPQDGGLRAVLAQMNRKAAGFRTASADFEWEQYTRVIDQRDIGKGQIYFRRNKRKLEVGVKIASPSVKKIVFKDGRVAMYEPNINKTTAGVVQDSADIEAGMDLGFGASGDELQKSFAIKLAGWEKVDGVSTARLELVPTATSSKLKSAVSKIVMWVDPARDVALKQQFWRSSGDYRLVHNTKIQLNPANLPDDAFEEGGLPTVLAQMNQKAAGFKSAAADFEAQVHTEVAGIKDTEIQKGRIYFRRNKKKELEIGIKMVSPAAKEIVYKEGKVDMYEPRINQTTERAVGKNSADVEAAMSLGFGGSGDELRKSFEVKLAGWEKVDGVNTARLELVPSSSDSKFKNTFSKIILWVDPASDVALKQQFLQFSGDYRLVHNTNIQVNPSKLPDDAFRLNNAGSHKVVVP